MTTEQTLNRRVLWVDDDPKERFVFEEYILTEKDNWEIHWAKNVAEGVKKLSTITFDALLLDQMLPVSSERNNPELWGGFYLLCWLRSATEKLKKALESRNGHMDWIWKSELPLAGNKGLPVIMLSAYHDDTVLKETKAISKQEEDLVFLSKPIEIDMLRKYLNQFRK